MKRDFRWVWRRLQRSWIAPLIGGLASSVPFQWVKRPDIAENDSWCLFVTYAPDGKIPAHSLFHARAWAAAGFKVNLTVVLDRLERLTAPADLSFASGVLLRLNRGYDFGAWAATMNLLPDLRKSALVAIANDSIYGPFPTFPAVLERVRQAEADIVGLTESQEFERHFQSFVLFFRQRALRHPAFVRFWRGIRIGDRWFVIRNYELKFISAMERAGLRTLALFPCARRDFNPTVSGWRALVDDGFPYVKVQLLRDNPRNLDLSDWKAVIESNGFDPALIEGHIGAVAERPHAAP